MQCNIMIKQKLKHASMQLKHALDINATYMACFENNRKAEPICMNWSAAFSYMQNILS